MSNNFAFGYQNGGTGGVSDIKDTYVSANEGSPITDVESPYTITEQASVFAEVDTTTAAVTINPVASPEEGDRLLVLDAGGNAGTNIITITGLGTIESDGGKKEWYYDGAAWKLLDVSQVHFTRNAATGEVLLAGTDKLRASSIGNKAANVTIDENGAVVATSGSFGSSSSKFNANDTGFEFDINGEKVFKYTQADGVEANKSSFGSLATTYSNPYASFINLDTNVDSDGTSHGNIDTILGPNLSTSGTIEAATGSTPENMIDGDSGTEYAPTTSGSSVVDFTIDLGLNYEIAYATISFRTVNSSYGVRVTKIELSTDNSNFTTYWSGSESTTSTTHVTRNFNLSNTSGQRYARITVNAAHPTNSQMRISEVTLHETDFANTQNTIETSYTASGVTIAPASCKVYDENDLEITNGSNVNIEYSTDNGSAWSTQENLTSFKARSNIVSAGIFQVRLAAVGGQRISAFDAVGPSVKNNTSSTGQSLVVNGGTRQSFDLDGNLDFVGSVTALTDGVNVAVDGSLGPVFSLTPTQNFILDNPTNLRIGKLYFFEITQDGAGSRLITFDTAFKGTLPTLSTGAGQKDLILCVSPNGTDLVVLQSILNF